MTAKPGSDGEPDQQRRIQMPDDPVGDRGLVEDNDHSGDDVAIKMGLEIIPNRIIGDQQAQDDNRTLRQAGAAHARQSPGEEDRDERRAG